VTPNLHAESEKLARSWERHEAAMLRDYLVADVEDPRLNVQSLLTRHYLLFSLFGDRFTELATEELRFAAVMNWLLGLAKDPGTDAGSVLHSLRVGADNAEGVEIPAFVARAFRQLPRSASGVELPNYVAAALERAVAGAAFIWPPAEFDTFMNAWSAVLASAPAPDATVIEPACGSANDYRFFHRCGLARLVRYAGFDISAKNIRNAGAMFPGVSFAVGNAFDLPVVDGAFDFTVVHDLFEHLSDTGIEQAVAEVCRVTRRGLCVAFFNMEEVPEHLIRPVEEYHWNLLSMERMRAAFAAAGFHGQVIHVGAFLRARVGCLTTHNPNAYTFLLGR
jgi:ubiquinone/menaquinone biosynthesis C-methylase UbiE